jgi:hypothetical protein
VIAHEAEAAQVNPILVMSKETVAGRIILAMAVP